MRAVPTRRRTVGAAPETRGHGAQERAFAHPTRRSNSDEFDMNWTPKALYQFVAELAEARRDAEVRS
jgi:hypothetical protein